jgi:DNA-binding beta-propeller fold protein YncE
MSGPLGADSRVGDYMIEAEIGRGGMGVVYRARHERLERAVALKVIAPNLAEDPTFRGRFDRESRLAASIEHPNAVPVYEAGDADGLVFIAMRLIEGTDLGALLRERSWLEAERAATLIDQVAGALDAAHARGLVHRDVKPGNVLIGEVGGREWAYLTDFGLSKRTAGATELTESGDWIGTVDYASPEQIQGEELDARSDVYSLGCVLYEALTGRIPFERDEPVAKLYAHVNDPPPTVSEALPEPAPSLDAVIARALAKRPADRFPSAGDLGRAALAATRGDRPTQPERSVARGEAAPESQSGSRALTRPIAALTTRLGRDAAERSRWVLPAASLAVLVLLAAIVWAAVSFFGGDGESGPEVIGTTEVGERPLSVSVGGGFAWVTNEGDGTVSRVDAETGQLEGSPIGVGDEPSSVRVGGGSVWVANAGSDTVTRIGLKSFEAKQTIRVGGRPTAVRVGAGSVWVTNTDDGTVSRIDPDDGRVIKTTRVGNRPVGVDVGDDVVWVVNSGDGDVSRLSAKSGEALGNPIEVGSQPRGITIGQEAVWVSNSIDDSVSRINEGGLDVGEPIPVGDQPAQLTSAEGFVWVANQGDDSVSQIDPALNEAVGEPIAVGDEPRGIDGGDGLIWVVNSESDTVSRIDP